MELNTTYAGNGTYNVNPGPNPPNPGPVIGYIAIPRDKYLSPAELASLETTLRALAVQDNPRLRVYGILNVITAVPQNTDPNTETLGNGQTVVTRDARPTWLLTFSGTLGDHLNLVKYRGSQGTFRWLRIHDGATIYISGTIKKVAGVEHMGGIDMTQVYVGDRDEAQPDAIAKTRMWLMPTNPRQYNQDIAYVKVDFDPIDVLEGLSDVKVVATPTGTPGQFFVRLLHGSGRADLSDTFSANFAQLTAFTVRNRVPNSALNGNVIPFAIAAGQNGWTLTVTTTNANYPAVGQPIEINLSAPSVLAAAPIDVDGIEGVPAIVPAT